MIDWVILAVLILGGLLVRIAPPLALLIGASFGMVVVVSARMGISSDAVTELASRSIYTVLTSYVSAALVLLVFFGAVFERCGTVMALPFGGKDSALPLDRSTGFSGGALGLPLPAMAAVILLSMLTDSSITKALTTMLPALIGLSLIYLAIFLPTALTGSRRERHPALPADTPSLVLSCAVPPAFMVLLILSTADGMLTPTAAIGAATILATVVIILHICLSANARAAFGDGIIRGAGAAVMTIVLLIALNLFVNVFAIAGMPSEIAGTAQQVSQSPYLVVMIALVVGLGIGALAGPLTGVGLAAMITYPAVQSMGIDPLNFIMLMAVTAEAVRVGPQLHGKGFRNRISDDGTVSLGSWPFYAAAIGVAALTPLIPPVN